MNRALYRIQTRRIFFGRRSVSGKRLIVLGMVVLLACCLAMAGCRGGEEPAEPAETESAPSETAAAPDAPVVIEAYYPLNESHQFIADYLYAIGDANPGKVHVTVYDMQSEEGRKKWMTTGLSCAGVFVNGSTRHTITRGEETETVDLLKRMGVTWTREDLLAVVQQELDKVGETVVPPQESTESAEDAE
jgi:hypothetical protein